MIRFIRKMGVELEGGWDSEPPDAENCWHGDSSVRVGGDWRAGEMVSPVCRSRIEIRDFIRTNYPDHIGNCCGLHVHMSFGDRNAGVLAVLADSEDFETFLREKLRLWGVRKGIRRAGFYDRLNGENSYCRLGYSAEPFVREAGRYRVVNFDAWHRHGTVEIRVLPMFKSTRIAEAAVMRVMAITEAYLNMRYSEGLDAAAESTFLAEPILPMADLSDTEVPSLIDGCPMILETIVNA